MPRKATGNLVWHKESWYGRYWATVDGKRKREFVSLETLNEWLAKKKLAKLVAANAAKTAVVDETLKQAAERIIADRRRTTKSARAEASYFSNHITPKIGTMPVTAIGKVDVMTVLEAVRDGGYSAQMIIHVRNAMTTVFKALRREGKIDSLPIPETDELPECLPEAINNKAKAVLSDDELLCYLLYTDPREYERFRGPVRERQLMALFSRCVGGMRQGEMHGLTWSRVAAATKAFDQVEVVRYKAQRKAARRGSKAISRQLYPLADTCLPLFLRFWHVRTSLLKECEPDLEAPLFPVRRARRAGAQDRVGERRGDATWARALRRDVSSAFMVAHKRKDPRAPKEGSQRWRELFEGTDDRRQLWFHSTRNMAAIAIERIERLKASARFTGHASVSMLQHYREMAGEVDVVPVVPEFLPDQAALLEVLRAWCEAEGIDPALIFGAGSNGSGEPPGKRHIEKARDQKLIKKPLNEDPDQCAFSSKKSLKLSHNSSLGSDCSIQLSYGSNEPQPSEDTRETQPSTEPLEKSSKGRLGILKRHMAQTTANVSKLNVAALPSRGVTAADLVRAADALLVIGDVHGARRLLAEAAERATAAEELKADIESHPPRSPKR